MRSTFFGVEVARRALWANLRAMDVTAHNVANANTPGYSRQVAYLSATEPHRVAVPGSVSAGDVGTGVEVARIERLRSQFVDQQIWSARAELSGWSTRRQVLEQVEVVLQEPSEAGLQAALDRWFDAVDVLAANPESRAARYQVLERAGSLVATFQALDDQWAALEAELSEDLQRRVETVNQLASQVDALNRRIVRAESTGHQANDLRDERARLVEELSRQVDVRVRETSTGYLRVTVGGTDLVGEGGARRLVLDTSGGAPDLRWEDQARPVVLRAGALTETLSLVAQALPAYREDLLQMAQTLADAVNAVHRNGYGLDNSTGLDFFQVPAGGLTRMDQLAVNPTLTANADAIGASSAPDTPGDGSNALAIGDLKSQPMFASATFSDYYRSWIAAIGARSQEAQLQEHSQQKLLNQLVHQREEVSGVSLDEEMAAMLQYRQAYNAAARLLTTVDEMLTTLINGTGVVGR